MSAIKSPSIFWLLILVTISGFTTSYSSNDVIWIIKVILMNLIIGVIIYILSLGVYSKSLILSIGLCLFLFTYNFFGGVINGVELIRWSQNFMDLTITLCAVILFSHQHKIHNYIIPKEISNYFIVYVLFMLVVVYLLGGLIFEFPPKFIYQVASDVINREETYSLSLTGIFSISIIFSIFKFIDSTALFWKLNYFFLFLLFNYLAFLAGGRGEIISAFFVSILFYIHKNSWHNLIFTTVLSAFGLMAILNFFTDTYGLVALERFAILIQGADYSYRDILLGQVLSLLLSELRCLLVGCGAGFFQTFYNYEFGLYPHNHLAEAVVIFGLPLTVTFFIFGVHGLILYYRKVSKIDLFILVFFYNFLVALKSGYFFGNWFLNGGITFLIGLSISSFFVNRDIYDSDKV